MFLTRFTKYQFLAVLALSLGCKARNFDDQAETAQYSGQNTTPALPVKAQNSLLMLRQPAAQTIASQYCSVALFANGEKIQAMTFGYCLNEFISFETGKLKEPASNLANLRFYSTASKDTTCIWKFKNFVGRTKNKDEESVWKDIKWAKPDTGLTPFNPIKSKVYVFDVEPTSESASGQTVKHDATSCPNIGSIPQLAEKYYPNNSGGVVAVFDRSNLTITFPKIPISVTLQAKNGYQAISGGSAKIGGDLGAPLLVGDRLAGLVINDFGYFPLSKSDMDNLTVP